MNDVTLLGLQESVYTRIARLALEEKGVSYKLEEVDIFAESGPPESYLSLHPFCRIPCLLHGDRVLYETAAITRYLDEQFDGPELQPETASARARMNQVIGVLDSYAYRPMVWDVYVQRVILADEGETPEEKVIAEGLRKSETVLAQMEHWLADNAFLGGESMTLADLHGLPILVCFSRAPDGSLLLERYTRVTRWLNRMRARASAQFIW